MTVYFRFLVFFLVSLDFLVFFLFLSTYTFQNRSTEECGYLKAEVNIFSSKIPTFALVSTLRGSIWKSSLLYT